MADDLETSEGYFFLNRSGKRAHINTAFCVPSFSGLNSDCAKGLGKNLGKDGTGLMSEES